MKLIPYRCPFYNDPEITFSKEKKTLKKIDREKEKEKKYMNLL